MASTELIDAQFDRAVEIVQSLPKTGPVQTDYEEKLTMYSLFKQATVGNVKGPRPGIFDMLGRAKWDAWEKHNDLDPYEAKWLYVDALLKVLRRYSDKTIATTLVQELESYGGDPSNLVMSRSFSKSPGSDSSGSTVSDSPTPFSRQTRPAIHTQPNHLGEQGDDSNSEDDDSTDEARDAPLHANTGLSADTRPQSSMSSHRYRTPLTSSLIITSPQPHHQIPTQQPLPGFETPSAFAESTSIPSSIYPQTKSYSSPYSGSVRPGTVSPPQPYQPYRSHHPGQMRSHSTPALERAVENVQAHLAALTERLEILESRSVMHRSNLSGSPRGATPSWMGGRHSPNDGTGPLHWDIDDMGMWSMVLNPLSRGIDQLKTLSAFFAKNENRSPSMIILRRLCLDISFLVSAVVLIGALWRRSGVRRREVKVALVVLWRAIVGHRPPRSMVERGV